jgi:hypothetical protein
MVLTSSYVGRHAIYPRHPVQLPGCDRLGHYTRQSLRSQQSVNMLYCVLSMIMICFGLRKRPSSSDYRVIHKYQEESYHSLQRTPCVAQCCVSNFLLDICLPSKTKIGKYCSVKRGSESKTSYIIMLVHDVRGGCCWYDSRGWTFPADSWRQIAAEEQPVK